MISLSVPHSTVTPSRAVWLALAVVIAATLPGRTDGHGFMIRPAMRGSMYRFPRRYPDHRGLSDPDENHLIAGGPTVVRANYPTLSFGVCGDPFTDARPRAHETGGRYGLFAQVGRRAVSECYASGGALVDVQIQMDVTHGGRARLDLCVPGAGRNESERCFRRGFALQRDDGEGEWWDLSDRLEGRLSLQYRLPSGVLCAGRNRCVLRWYWETGAGNVRNINDYWNCADIQISSRCTTGGTPAPTTSSPPAPPRGAGPCACSGGNRCGARSRQCRPNTCLFVGPRPAGTTEAARDRLCIDGWTQAQCEAVVESTDREVRASLGSGRRERRSSFSWCPLLT